MLQDMSLRHHRGSKAYCKPNSPSVPYVLYFSLIRGARVTGLFALLLTLFRLAVDTGVEPVILP